MSGYDDFFKKAKKESTVKKQEKQNKKNVQMTSEEYLRAALNVRPGATSSKRERAPYFTIALILCGMTFGGVGYLYPEKIEKIIDHFDVGVLALAKAEVGSAESAAGATANSALSSSDKSAGNAAQEDKPKETTCLQQKGFSEEELSHFNRLNDRKHELDLRDAELTTMEEELHKQKIEVEERIVKLEKIRDEIARVLKDKVEIDQQRVNTLVEFYSNMKPKQAAEIFATLNEDLAVEVLGKIKKKNAADIMNLLNAEKARALSEKFTGYKRR